jgi:hypothetical protein
MITVSGYQADLAAIAKARASHGKGGEPLTDAHVSARAEMDAACAGDGRCEDGPVAADDAPKGVGHLEAAEGPGRGLAPHDMPDAGAYDRPYLDAGHSAPSPQHQPPRTAPMPPEGRGILTPIELAGAPVVVGSAGPMMTTLAAHQAKATLRPAIPRGSA